MIKNYIYLIYGSEAEQAKAFEYYINYLNYYNNLDYANDRNIGSIDKNSED